VAIPYFEVFAVSSKRQLRRLGFESLERREMLAGNISASVNASGQLLLRGDWQDNVFIASKGAVEGRIVVSGGKDYAGRNTAVNGSFQPQVFEGVTHFKLEMYGPGNDRALFTNLDLPDLGFSARSILADMGHGNDQVVISGDVERPLQFERNDGAAIPYGPVNIGGPVYVLGRAGNDTFSSVNAAFGGRSTFVSGFDGGPGDDHFYINGLLELNQLGTTRINMGSGNDSVTLRNLQGRLAVQTISVNNPPGTIDIDVFRLRGGLNLNTAGRDRAIISMVDVELTTPFLGIEGTSGSDQITMDRVRAGEFRLNTRGGNDQVTIRNSRFETQFDERGMDVHLGGGDDVLTLQNVFSRGQRDIDTALNGGDGFDRFENLGGNDLGRLAIHGFQEVVE
jgi:hypothetical protein